MTQIELFLREYHYNKAQKIWRLLDEHTWSRSLTQRDANVIIKAQQSLMSLANDLYHLHKEIKAHNE